MKKLKFGDALKQLQAINSQLEDGKLEIEEALKLYERGIKLYKLCEEKLAEAKVKFEEISK